MAKKNAKTPKSAAQKAAGNNNPAAGLKIAIDPGHGMSNATPGVFDSGAVSPGGVREADVALGYGLALEARLQGINVRTFMTRRNNTSPTPVGSRASAAAQAGCTHFVSLHLNDSDEPAAHGIETLYRDDGKDKPLAKRMQEAVVAASGFRDRGIVQRLNLAVLKFAPGPAILIELGFISNSHDLADLLDPDVRSDIIDAIVSVLVPASGVVAPAGTFQPALIAPFHHSAGTGASLGISYHGVTLDGAVLKTVCDVLMMYIGYQPSLLTGNGQPAQDAPSRGLTEPCRRIAEQDAHTTPAPNPTRLRRIVNDLKVRYPGLALESQQLRDGDFPFVGDLVFHIQSN